MENLLLENELYKAIVLANQCYREGIPLTEEIKIGFSQYPIGTHIPDWLYDEWVGKLRSINPDHHIFFTDLKRHEVQRKVKLPFLMPSLDKVKTVEELKEWFMKKGVTQDELVVITPKYDGIAFLLKEKGAFENSERIAWTGGDGVYGQVVTEHYHLIRDIKNFPLGSVEEYTFGEVVISKEDFVKYKKEGYKNPRNMVAGLFNSKNPTPPLKDVCYIRFGMFETDRNKLSQLECVNKNNMFQIPYEFCYIWNINQALLDNLYEEWGKIFEIDGLVIEINADSKRKELGFGSTGNPNYSVAYKGNFEEVKDTEVIGIEWKVSKQGYVKPVLLVNPIELDGVEVKRVSAYNAIYLLREGINVGAKVKVKRSGKVIPVVVEVDNETTLPLMELKDLENTKCPSCGGNLVWSNSGKDLVCENDLCRGVRIAKLVNFFSVLEVEDFLEETIEKFFDAGFNSISKILSMKKADMVNIEGMGNLSASNLQQQFLDKVYVPNFYKLQSATGFFKNLGETLLSEVPLNSLKDLDLVTKEMLVNLEGFSEIRAESYLRGIEPFKKFLEENSFIEPIVEDRKVLLSYSLKSLRVVFTGFRNRELEEKIERNGGIVSNSISRENCVLLVSERGVGTSKEKKALQLGIEILLEKEFVEKYFADVK